MTDDTLAAAMARAAAKLTNPPKDGKANLGHGRDYTYATLGGILDHVRPVLAAEGIWIAQDPVVDNGRVEMWLHLTHRSGESQRFGPIVFGSGQNPQTAGSGITYARKYQLAAVLGVAGDEVDDDGARAVNPPTRSTGDGVAPVDVGTRRGQAARDWATTPATDDQRKMIGRLVRDAGYPDTVTFLASPEAAKILGGRPSTPLVKGHASSLIDALIEWQTAPDTEPADTDVDEAAEDYEATR